MDDSRPVGLAFSGMLIAAFAVLIALFSGAADAALGLFLMAVFCAVEFVCGLNFDIVSEL